MSNTRVELPASAEADVRYAIVYPSLAGTAQHGTAQHSVQFIFK
jgi:hypothetical protein